MWGPGRDRRGDRPDRVRSAHARSAGRQDDPGRARGHAWSDPRRSPRMPADPALEDAEHDRASSSRLAPSSSRTCSANELSLNASVVPVRVVHWGRERAGPANSDCGRERRPAISASHGSEGAWARALRLGDPPVVPRVQRGSRPLRSSHGGRGRGAKPSRRHSPDMS